MVQESIVREKFDMEGEKLPKIFPKRGLVLFCLTPQGGISFLFAVINRSLCLLKRVVPSCKHV